MIPWDKGKTTFSGIWWAGVTSCSIYYNVCGNPGCFHLCYFEAVFEISVFSCLFSASSHIIWDTGFSDKYLLKPRLQYLDLQTLLHPMRDTQSGGSTNISTSSCCVRTKAWIKRPQNQTPFWQKNRWTSTI